jgi:transposase InsO family protein
MSERGTLRTDNGLEFVNHEMRELTHQYGIRHQRTVVYTPEQNGSAERDNRTLMEAARTLLNARKFEPRFWAEAVNTVVSVLNLTGTSSVKRITPHELWVQKEPRIKDLRIFGEEVFTHIPKQKR